MEVYDLLQLELDGFERRRVRVEAAQLEVKDLPFLLQHVTRGDHARHLLKLLADRAASVWRGVVGVGDAAVAVRVRPPRQL